MVSGSPSPAHADTANTNSKEADLMLNLTGSFYSRSISRHGFCSAHGLLLKPAIGTPLKTKVRPWGTATVGSARPGMFVLSGGVDGGGVGVGVSSEDCVVLGAEHVKQSTVSTECT